jgi:hypothetical protein
MGMALNREMWMEGHPVIFQSSSMLLTRVSSNYLDKRLPKIVQVGMTYYQYQLSGMNCFHDSKKEGAWNAG